MKITFSNGVFVLFSRSELKLSTNKSDDSTIAQNAFFLKNASLGFICFLIGA